MSQSRDEVDYKVMLEQLFLALVHFMDDPDVDAKAVPRLAIETMLVNAPGDQLEDLDATPMVKALRELVRHGGFSQKLTQSLLDNELLVQIDEFEDEHGSDN